MWTYSRVGPVKRRVLCMDCVSEKLPIWSLASDRLTAALTAALMEVIRMNMYGFTFKCHLQHTKAPKNGMRRAEAEANKCCVHNPPAKESYKYFSFFFVSPRKKKRDVTWQLQVASCSSNWSPIFAQANFAEAEMQSMIWLSSCALVFVFVYASAHSIIASWMRLKE